MAFEFILPDIGEGLTEATVVRWVVVVGEEVGLDEVLVEVETAKAVVEMPSPVAGVVVRHGAGEGETLEVGSVLAVIDQVDAPVETPESDAPLVGTLSDQAVILPRRSETVEVTRSAVQALPVVRKLAKDRGVDINEIHASGPDGRVTRDDVMAASSDGAPADSDRVRLSPLRKAIAEHMEKSWREIPHVTTFDEADATRLLTSRKALAARHGQSIPFEALLVKAVIPVLTEYRQLNASLDGDEIVLHGAQHIAIAVDTEAGLIAPVITDADQLSLIELATTVEDLAAGARARTLAPDQLTGATFTISNIGAVGGTHGTPIIPLGTTAIISVGRATDKAVARDGGVVVAPMMPLSLSFDHRVIDGGMGRRFMALLKENLEEPALFLA